MHREILADRGLDPEMPLTYSISFSSAVFGKPVRIRHGPATVSGDEGHTPPRAWDPEAHPLEAEPPGRGGPRMTRESGDRLRTRQFRPSWK